MTRKILTAAICVGVLSTIGTAVQQPPNFRSSTRTVAVFATVQDRAGRLVPDLTREEFEVLDNGRQVEISVFSNEPQPITAVVMLDMSGSMWSQLPRLQTSLEYVVSTLRPGDRIRIGTFGTEVSLSHWLTGDGHVLRRVIREELWPGGSSPLWRALDMSMTSLAGEQGRRVVLALTDGVNHAPGGKGLPEIPGGFGSVTRRAVADPDVMFYAVGYGDPHYGQRLRGDIVDLTDLTGGGHTNVPPSADLGQAFARIGEELRHQYLIGFVPDTVDGPARRLEVRSKRSGVKVRARTTYLPGDAR